MTGKPLPKSLTEPLRHDSATTLELIVSQVIDRARKGESFFQDDIVGLEDAHKSEVAHRLWKLSQQLNFIAVQMQPDVPSEGPLYEPFEPFGGKSA